MTSNPKQAAGDKKVPLQLLEPAANAEIAKALADGARKYGRRNYRQSGPIYATTYVGAIQRHLDAYKNGEWEAPDSGVSHLGHIGACLHVMLSAMEAGTFEDDLQGEPVKQPDSAVNNQPGGAKTLKYGVGHEQQEFPLPQIKAGQTWRHNLGVSEYVVVWVEKSIIGLKRKDDERSFVSHERTEAQLRENFTLIPDDPANAERTPTFDKPASKVL